jgi:tRNA(Ile)-lysidine synthase
MASEPRERDELVVKAAERQPTRHIQGERGKLDPAVAKGRNQLLTALADLGPGERVEAALSGGADSLALAACLAFVGRKAGWDCGAVVIDHGLQAASAAVAETAAAQACELGLDAEIVRVDVGIDGGLESAARDARSGVFRARPAAAVLLAHTMDDQAETVLLGLGRGSGPRAIAGMPAANGALRRPFLGVRRAETEQICAASGLVPWSDPHNLDPRFRRSRLRHEVMPLLDDVLGGGVVEALARTSAQVRTDVDFLDELVADHVGDLAIDQLESLDPALRSRVLRQAALEAGAIGSDLSATHIGELDRLVTDWSGQERAELPGRISAVRDGGALHFVPTPMRD